MQNKACLNWLGLELQHSTERCMHSFARAVLQTWQTLTPHVSQSRVKTKRKLDIAETRPLKKQVHPFDPSSVRQCNAFVRPGCVYYSMWRL